MEKSKQSSAVSAKETEERVESLLKKMSLEEKIAQLNQVSGATFFPGPKGEDIIRKSGAGSILWLNDTKEFNRL